MINGSQAHTANDMTVEDAELVAYAKECEKTQSKEVKLLELEYRLARLEVTLWERNSLKKDLSGA